MIQKVGIVGRGAIGALYGTLLLEHGCHDVVFIVDPDRKKRYEQQPLEVNGEFPDFQYVTSGESLDLIMICTKYAGLSAAIQEIAPFVNQDTIILSCLNGIRSEEECRKVYGEDAVIRCIVQGMDSTYLNHTVDYSHVGEILFGSETPQQRSKVEDLKQFFSRYSIPYRECEDIVREQWNKLMLNCGINQVCAAHQVGYGGCQDHQPYQAEFVEAMKEVQTVANAKGISLTDQDIQDWIQLVNSLRPEGLPSMAQDILAHRKTELPLFSLTIIPMAKELSIHTPVLEKLCSQILELEKNF